MALEARRDFVARPPVGTGVGHAGVLGWGHGRVGTLHKSAIRFIRFQQSFPTKTHRGTEKKTKAKPWMLSPVRSDLQTHRSRRSSQNSRPDRRSCTRLAPCSCTSPRSCRAGWSHSSSDLHGRTDMPGQPAPTHALDHRYTTCCRRRA